MYDGKMCFFLTDYVFASNILIAQKKINIDFKEFCNLNTWEEVVKESWRTGE